MPWKLAMEPWLSGFDSASLLSLALLRLRGQPVPNALAQPPACPPVPAPRVQAGPTGEGSLGNWRAG